MIVVFTHVSQLGTLNNNNNKKILFSAVYNNRLNALYISAVVIGPIIPLIMLIFLSSVSSLGEYTNLLWATVALQRLFHTQYTCINLYPRRYPFTCISLNEEKQLVPCSSATTGIRISTFYTRVHKLVLLKRSSTYLAGKY